MTAQLTLSFGEEVRGPPARVVSFASGSNEPPEIRAFAGLGIPVGISAGRITRSGVAELLRLLDTELPVFGDTGAYAERERAAITPRGWLRRLAILETLSHRFGRRFSCVAPDRVGNQDESLARLRRFRDHCRCVAAAGAEVLLALPPGSRPRPEFHAEAAALLGIRCVPALPMARRLTSAAEAVAFVRATRPKRIHLLGLGLRSRTTRSLLPALAAVSPDTRITLDATLLTAAVGRRPDGVPRPDPGTGRDPAPRLRGSLRRDAGAGVGRPPRLHRRDRQSVVVAHPAGGPADLP